MPYARLGQSPSCDPSTQVASVNGNYQCCPTDTNCINEVGLPTGTAPTPGPGVPIGLTYGTGSSLWWWLAAGVALTAFVLWPKK